jgi:uncharacterized membrane protein required for colicin V production
VVANPVTVSINEYVLIAIALAVFGLIGFRRGVNRELVTFAGVLVALALSSLFASAMVPFVNKMYRITHFVFAGGISAENPTVGWNEAKLLPDLVNSPMSKAIMELVVFSIPVLISYVIGGRVKAAGGAGQRILGMLMGAVSGFFIAQHFIPILFPAGETRLELATGPATNVLQNTQVIAVLVVVVVVILVAFGLYSSRRVIKK